MPVSFASRRRRRPVPPVGAALLVGAAVVAAGLVGAAPAGAAGDDEVSWGVHTADGDLGSGRQNYEYRVDPGGSVRDAMVVTNHDDAPVELDVYGADGFTTGTGELGVLTRDERSTDLGAWISPDTERLVVAPNASAQVPFTIAVPADATPGDHAGAILTSLTTGGQQGVGVERRLGIRIHLRVTGDVTPRLAIENLRVHYAGVVNPFGAGTATVTYTVHNTGNIRLGASQAASATGPFGRFAAAAGTLDAVPELLPGESWDVTVPIAHVVPSFRLGAHVTLDPVPPDDSVPPVAQVEATATTWAVPWPLLALVLLVGAGIATRVALARRTRSRRQVAEQARVQEAIRQALRARDDAEGPATPAEPSEAGRRPVG